MIQNNNNNNDREDNVIQLSVWISISKFLSLHHRNILSLAVTAKHYWAGVHVRVSSVIASEYDHHSN